MTIITSLDIGSHEIRAVVTNLLPEEEIQIIGVAKVLSRGVKKGVIIDIHEASQAITQVLREAESISGIRLNSVVTGINGVNLQSITTKGIIAVSRADREISENDIDRALKAAQNASLAPNREILEVVSRDFVIDSEEGIKNPVGMSGIRLEVNTVIVTAYAAFLRNLLKAIELGGWKVTRHVPGPLASAQAVISHRQRDLGVVVCDIGSDTTGIAIYEEGELLHVEVLPVGAGLITSDIAIGLRIDIDTAETIKVKYGTILANQVRKSEMIELDALGFGEDLRIRRQEVAEIIEARMREMLSLISKVVDKTGKKNFLPAGVVLVGGGAKLEGLVPLAKDILHLPVRIGYPEQFRGLVDQVTDPLFAKACGLVLYHLQDMKPASPNEHYIQKVSASLKNFLRRLLP